MTAEAIGPMTKIAILPKHSSCGARTFWAVAGNKQSTGRTAGEALDALVSQLPPDDTGTMVVLVSNPRPDQFFAAAQRERLSDLMGRWRAARDGGGSFDPAEQGELDALVKAELRGSAERTAALLNELGGGS